MNELLTALGQALEEIKKLKGAQNEERREERVNIHISKCS